VRYDYFAMTPNNKLTGQLVPRSASPPHSSCLPSSLDHCQEPDEMLQDNLLHLRIPCMGVGFLEDRTTHESCNGGAAEKMVGQQ
jgi:hypothetical protein